MLLNIGGIWVSQKFAKRAVWSRMDRASSVNPTDKLLKLENNNSKGLCKHYTYSHSTLGRS
jgi:hypothetical protein